MPSESTSLENSNRVLYHKLPTSMPSLTGNPKRRSRKKSSPKNRSLRKPGTILLKHTWTMWFDEGFLDTTSEESRIGTFNTIQDFWRYYNQIVDPSSFPSKSNLSIYKENPTTSFELPDKICKWTIPCSKNDTGKVWMKVVLAMIGEQFMHSHSIAGVVISVNPVIDKIILWGSKSLHGSAVDEITNQVRKLVENDTFHMVSYHKEIFSGTQKETRETNEGSNFQSARKYVSSSNLVAEEIAAKKHKKSSSFSNSQFPDIKGSYVKRHRKTKSDTKKSSIEGRKSISFSDELASESTPSLNTKQLSNKRLSLFAQMYNNGPAVPEPFQIAREQPQMEVIPTTPSVVENNANANPINLYQVLSLFVLVLLVLSGFIFTPK